MESLKGEAVRGMEVKSQDFRVQLWVKRRCRSCRHRVEEEQRVLGDRRCSRSERWPNECWAVVRLSSGCEADSDAAGWTSESPGRDNADMESQQTPGSVTGQRVLFRRTSEEADGAKH